MNLYPTCTDISLGDRQTLIGFYYLDPIFYVTGGQKRIKMPCLHSVSCRDGDFNQAAQIYHLEMPKKLLEFGDLDPIFKVTKCQRKLKNALSAFYLLKRW